MVLRLWGEPVLFSIVSLSWFQAMSDTSLSFEVSIFSACRTMEDLRLSSTEWRPRPPMQVGRWKKAQIVLTGRQNDFFTFFLTSESSLAAQVLLRTEVER